MTQRQQKRRDYFLLIMAGIACAVLAWLFWHFVGEQGFSILSIIVVVGVSLDNMRLRQRVSHLEERLTQDKKDYD